MIIDCCSDLHGEYPTLMGGDLLIVAGDITACDKLNQWKEFFQWLKKQPYDKKIVIAGNHDGFFKSGFPMNQKEANDLKEVQDFLKVMGEDIDVDFEYLCDFGTEYKGLKIYGSPWTPEFCNWHFMLPRGEQLKEKWDLIPDDTDILITHGPAMGILDSVYRVAYSKLDRVGCADLRDAVERVRPKLHVFGHIHASYGHTILKLEDKHVICVNAAHMNEDYEAVNPPIRIIYDEKTKRMRVG